MLCTSVQIAQTWHAKGIGLIGRPRTDSTILLLKNVSAIHTIGMSFDLDVAFLDLHGVCLLRLNGVKPWRIVIGPRGTASVIETKAALPSVLEKIRIGVSVSVELA